MTGGPMAKRNLQAKAIAEEFPGWEAWQGLDGRWHARMTGAVPPVMVPSDAPDGLREQIRGQAR
jgi:hypothetical protein